MINRCENGGLVFRDGTSQQGRRMPALDPSYFSIEERSKEDLIRFARNFARELKFYNLQNRVEGDWSGFLGVPENEEQIKDMLDYLEDPDPFKDQPEKLRWLTRPQLSVFFSFLEMLKEPKKQLDDLTRRHLDFYYREVLQLPEKPAIPDRVHVLFEPERGVEAHMVQAGTLLYGGKDSEGNDLHYATDGDLLVTQARVADIRRVYRDDETGHIFADIPWQQGKQPDPNQKFHALGTDLIGIENNQYRQGFAITSPLLNLSQGHRIIYLNFKLQKELNFEDISRVASIAGKSLEFSLIYENGNWKIPSKDVFVYPDNIDDPRLKVLGLVPSSAPEIVGGVEEFSGSNPVLIVTPDLNQLTIDEFKTLQGLKVGNLQLQVSVNEREKGISELPMKNNDGLINSQSSFFPFGSWPKVGASFLFSHNELCAKPISHLNLRISWKGSDNLDQRYQAYVSTGFFGEHDIFKAQLRISDFQGLNPEPKRLFPEPDFSFSFSDTILPAYTLDRIDSGDPIDYPRSFRISLIEPDFQHSNFPLVIQAHSELPSPKPRLYPPYTPEVEEIELGYTSGIVTISTSASDESTNHYFLYLNPFGYSRPTPENQLNNNDVYLFPIPSKSGNLYIGIKDVQSTARLSLLLQIHPGFSDKKPPELKWSYLANNYWHTIPEKQILVDQTKKLLNAGILQIELPRVTDLNHQALPAGLYWLRASADNPDAAGDLIAIHAQAVAATWINQGNTSDHLDQPLPAENITELLRRDPNISTVSQPYTSFGARPAELSEYYHTRVSERLRHKKRALTTWDFERLVLENFPEVYKAKCLTAREKVQLVEKANPEPEVEEKKSLIAPDSGKVVLVLIPNLALMEPFFPLEPRLPNDKRKEIENFLKQYVSPFAKVEVRNPRFEYVRYRMDIRFHRGYDENLYSRKLNEEIHRFLCPWAYQASADISFGSRIYHSEVIYFIENLPYVDYVANFKLARQFQGEEDKWGCPPGDFGCVSAQFPDSILISYPNHLVGEVETEVFNPNDYKGIGYELIGIDLMIP